VKYLNEMHLTGPCFLQAVTINPKFQRLMCQLCTNSKCIAHQPFRGLLVWGKSLDSPRVHDWRF